jgi:hypothetical protein
MSVIAGKCWEERDKENKMEYAIVVEDFDPNTNIITRIYLERVYRPLGFNYGNRWGHVWIVEYDAGELRVKCIERAYEWNGTYTKTKYLVSIKTDFVELPWIFNWDELEDEIDHYGVKYGIQAILGYIKDLFTIYLKTPEELPEKIG